MTLLRERSEEGATAVLMAVTLVVFFGMLALSLDIGGMLVLRRRLVGAVDAAALAAAQTCALDENAGAAQSQAVAYVDENYAASASEDPPGVAFLDDSCDADGGRVQVHYDATHQNDVASLDFLWDNDNQEISVEATALWGIAGGSHDVVPMSMNVGDDGLVPCPTEVDENSCGSWWDGDEGPVDFANSSHWGWMNTDEDSGWDVDIDDPCPNAGHDLTEGIQEGLDLVLSGPITYVCINRGATTPAWNALEEAAEVDRIVDVPIHDPEEMDDDQTKFAVIGFARMRIEEVIPGNSDEAHGAPSEPIQCGGTMRLVRNTDYDLDTLCADVPVSLDFSSVTLSKGSNEYAPGIDYSYNVTTHVFRWLSATENGVKVEVDSVGEDGACGQQTSDPNARCVVFSIPMGSISGFNPTPGPAFEGALQAVRLDS